MHINVFLAVMVLTLQTMVKDLLPRHTCRLSDLLKLTNDWEKLACVMKRRNGTNAFSVTKLSKT